MSVVHNPQRVIQETPVSCFRACIASLLGLKWSEVPDAFDGNAWNWDVAQDWLCERGLQAVEIVLDDCPRLYPLRVPVPCILTGKSPRECTTGKHAVVATLRGLEGFTILHDPHVSSDGIVGEPTQVTFLVPTLHERHEMDQPFGCVNNTIRLRSGKYFDLANPRPDQFDFADIAGALSKICRFGSQCESFYSVAEHLVNCRRVAASDKLSRDAQLAVLMHDATEAFVGDMVKPLKMMLPAYAIIEARVEAAIAEKFGIDFRTHANVIKEIDRAMLIAERRRLFSPDKVAWTGEHSVRKLSVDFRLWRPSDAEMYFEQEAQSLGVKVFESQH